MPSPSIFTAEADTGGLPPWKSLCEARPMCQSWRKMRPPAACTADVMIFQPASIASV